MEIAGIPMGANLRDFQVHTQPAARAHAGFPLSVNRSGISDWEFRWPLDVARWTFDVWRFQRPPRGRVWGRSALTVLLLPLLLPGCALPSRAPESGYRRCQPACVEVLIDGRHAGSGWLATGEGWLVTAGHLFERRGGAIELLWSNNARVPARLVAVDRGHDLALLQAANVPRSAKPLELALARPRPGEEIYQFGAPIFRSGVLQTGRVASDTTAFEFASAITDYAEVVLVAAMMQGGTSGGPWLNRRGQVVGTQSSTVSLEGKPVGIACLAPADAILRLLDRRQDAATPTPGLGVDEIWQQSAEFLAKLPSGTEGLVASVVRSEGPAAQAGIQARDVLIEADGQRLVRIADLLRIVRGHRPGDNLDLKFLRPGESGVQEARVVLGRAEEVWADSK